MLNFKILSHPMNWLTIWLMILIAGIFGHLLLTLFEQEPSTAKTAAMPAGLSLQQYPDVPAEAMMDAQITSAQSSYDAMMNWGASQQVIL